MAKKKARRARKGITEDSEQDQLESPPSGPVDTEPTDTEHTSTEKTGAPHIDSAPSDTESLGAAQPIPVAEGQTIEDNTSDSTEATSSHPPESKEDPKSTSNVLVEEIPGEQQEERNNSDNDITSRAHESEAIDEPVNEPSTEQKEEQIAGQTTASSTEDTSSSTEIRDPAKEASVTNPNNSTVIGSEEVSPDSLHSSPCQQEASNESTPDPPAEAPNSPDTGSDEARNKSNTSTSVTEEGSSGSDTSNSPKPVQETERAEVEVVAEERPAALRLEAISAPPPAAPTPPVSDGALPAPVGAELRALPQDQSGRARPILEPLEDPLSYRGPSYLQGHHVGRSFSGGYFHPATYSHTSQSHIPPVGTISPPLYSELPPHFYRRPGQGTGSHSSFTTNMSTPMQMRQPPFHFGSSPGGYPHPSGPPEAYSSSRRTGSFELRAGEYAPDFQEHAIIDDEPEEEEDVHLVTQIKSVIPAINTFLHRQKERQGTLGMREMTMREQLTAHQEARKQAEDQVQRHTDLVNSFRERLESATKSYESEIGKFRLHVGNLEEKQKDMEERIAEAREAKGFLQAQKEGLKKELEIVKRDLEGQRVTIEELEAAKAAAEKEKANLESRLEEVEKEKLANEEAAKEEHQNLLQEKLANEEAAKEEREKLLQEKNAAEESAKQAASEAERLQHALADLKTEAEESIKQEKERLGKEFEEQKTKAMDELEDDKRLIAEEFGRRLAGKQTELDEMQETLEKNTKELETNNEAKVALENQLAELKERLDAASVKAEETEKALTVERENMEKRLEDQRQQLEKEWQEKYDSLSQQHETAKEEHAKSLDSLREEHKRQLNEATAEHENSLAEIRAGHTRQLEEERENLTAQKDEAARVFAEMQADLTKQLEEEKQKSGKEREAMEAEFGKSKDDFERAITELKAVADNLDLEKGRLQKVIECFGDVADLKGKGDAYYRDAFSQLSKQIFDFASSHSDTAPSTPAPSDILARLPSNFPPFIEDTIPSRNLRAACIAHIVSRVLTLRIFNPFLFSLSHSNPNDNALLSSLSRHMREKSTRKEAVWRQHTLVAAFTIDGAKQNVNSVAANVVNEIVDAVSWFAEHTKREALETSVKRVVKLAAETWRFARLEREIIVAEMPDQDDDSGIGGSQFWVPFDFATVRGESGSVCSLSLTESATTAVTEDQLPASSKILLRVFPIIKREPIHEDLRIKEEEKEDDGFVYSKGYALYDEAESVLARRREVELAVSPTIPSPVPSRPQSRALTTPSDPSPEQGEVASEDIQSEEQPIPLLRVPPPLADIACGINATRPPTPPASREEASNQPMPLPSPLPPPPDDVAASNDEPPETHRSPSRASLNELTEEPTVDEQTSEEIRNIDVGTHNADIGEQGSQKSRPGSIKSVSTGSNANPDEQGSHRSSRSGSVRSSIIIQRSNSPPGDHTSYRSKPGSIRSVGTETGSGNAKEQGAHRSKSGSVRSIVIQRNKSMDEQDSYRSNAGSLKSMSTENSRSSRFHVESNQAAIKALYGNTARTRAALLERSNSTGSVRLTKSERSEADSNDASQQHLGCIGDAEQVGHGC